MIELLLERYGVIGSGAPDIPPPLVHANRMVFGTDGRLTSFQQPLVHSRNKENSHLVLRRQLAQQLPVFLTSSHPPFNPKSETRNPHLPPKKRARPPAASARNFPPTTLNALARMHPLPAPHPDPPPCTHYPPQTQIPHHDHAHQLPVLATSLPPLSTRSRACTHYPPQTQIPHHGPCGEAGPWTPLAECHICAVGKLVHDRAVGKPERWGSGGKA